MWYSKEYNPIQVGSIDGTDIDPHDAAITRATHSVYKPPKNLKSDPDCTLFISRLNFDTTEVTLRPHFEKYGSISTIELIRNHVTGLSQGYAFITFTKATSCREAYKLAHETTLDDHIILVDYERSRIMKGWVPRRLGGGFGGKKESGQLRFGARDRPFRDPHGKLEIDYEQKRSDNWKYSESKRSNNKRDRSNERQKIDHYHSDTSRRHSKDSYYDERYHRERYRDDRSTRDRYHRDTSNVYRHRSPSSKRNRY